MDSKNIVAVAFQLTLLGSLYFLSLSLMLFDDLTCDGCKILFSMMKFPTKGFTTTTTFICVGGSILQPGISNKGHQNLCQPA